MDLNDIWQEHKKFIIAVAAGLLVFLIGETIIGSSYTSKVQASERTLSSQRASLRQVKPTAKNLREIRDVQSDLAARWQAASEKLIFQSGKRFELRDDEARPDDVYFNVVNEVKREVEEAAERRNIQLPDNLGLPATTPRTREEAKRYLRALDVVQRVVRLAVEADVLAITDIDIPKGATRSKRNRRSRDDADFLERLELRFRVRGSAPSLVRLVESLQAPASYLVLAKDSRILGPEPDDPGPSEAVLVMAALDIESLDLEE